MVEVFLCMEAVNMAVHSINYTQASSFSTDKDWFRGELTRQEAEQTLTASGCDCFLVRRDKGELVLSLIHDNLVHHAKIEYGPGWYRLEGELQQTFSEVDDLVSHYRNNPITISEKLTIIIGLACPMKAIDKDEKGQYTLCHKLILC